MLALLLLACEQPASQSPTWNADIAPLVSEHCGSCHVDGTIAPFALDTYASASALGQAMVDAVDSGSMPPWQAQDTDECQPLRPWKNDIRLSEAEKDLLRDWVAAGAPEGDPQDLGELPEPPSLDLASVQSEVMFPVSYEVSGDSDEFICFVVDPGNAEPVWLTGVQMMPGNAEVAHHALIFLDTSGETADWSEDGSFPCFNTPSVDGSLVAAWAPGAMPTQYPEGVGVRMEPGARLVVQMHYHPLPDTSTTDHSGLQLSWTQEEPTWEAFQALIGNFRSYSVAGRQGLLPGPNDPEGGVEFRIPAGVADHTETMVYRQSFNLELPIYSVATHMHYVGTDMKIDLIRDNPGEGEPSEECLLQTPSWDFNWQRGYAYDVPIEELPTIGRNDQFHMRCTYDNTLNNPFVAEALAERGLSEPQDVYLGEETLDEMCLGAFGILLPPGLL